MCHSYTLTIIYGVLSLHILVEITLKFQLNFLVSKFYQDLSYTYITMHTHKF